MDSILHRCPQAYFFRPELKISPFPIKSRILISSNPHHSDDTYIQFSQKKKGSTSSKRGTATQNQNDEICESLLFIRCRSQVGSTETTFTHSFFATTQLQRTLQDLPKCLWQRFWVMMKQKTSIFINNDSNTVGNHNFILGYQLLPIIINTLSYLVSRWCIIFAYFGIFGLFLHNILEKIRIFATMVNASLTHDLLSPAKHAVRLARIEPERILCDSYR